MKYVEFPDAIDEELQRTSDGLAWVELRDRCGLPYARVCPAWTKQLEEEIGLSRTKGSHRALIWECG